MRLRMHIVRQLRPSTMGLVIKDRRHSVVMVATCCAHNLDELATMHETCISRASLCNELVWPRQETAAGLTSF